MNTNIGANFSAYYNNDNTLSPVLYAKANNVYLNEDCSNMFNGCSSLNMNIENFLRDFKFDYVNNCSSMFNGCENIYGDMNKNFNNVNDCSKMFENCINVNFNYITVNNAINCSYMFCGSRLPDSFSMVNVVDISNMFCNCETTLSDYSLNNNFTKVKNASNCFRESNLKNITINDFQNCEDMSYMFFGCKNLQSITFQSGENNVRDVNMSHMFFNCNSNVNISLTANSIMFKNTFNPHAYGDFYLNNVNDLSAGSSMFSSLPSLVSSVFNIHLKYGSNLMTNLLGQNAYNSMSFDVINIYPSATNFTSFAFGGCYNSLYSINIYYGDKIIKKIVSSSSEINVNNILYTTTNIYNMRRKIEDNIFFNLTGAGHNKNNILNLYRVKGFNYINFSTNTEKNFDNLKYYITYSSNNVTVYSDMMSGENYNNISIDNNIYYNIYLNYHKDGSVNSGTDSCYLYLS